MKYTQGKYPIIKKVAIARQTYSFEILCPEIVNVASAGQFVHIRVDGFTLRRPVSICDINREKGTLRIVFEIRGDGTKIISELNESSFIDMLAPLGHGFTLNPDFKKVILIGGGIGTPPMLPLAKFYGRKATVITGFRSSDAIILKDDFRKTNAEIIICTDDGSYGINGFVTQPFEDIIKSQEIDGIYACGPMPMLKKIAETANKNNIFCEISLEERMGCGIGACLVCACKTKKNDEEYFAHVCKEGPVFNSKEVIF